MQLEIELKARVADPEALRIRLKGLGAQFQKHYRKEDGYWRLPCPGNGSSAAADDTRQVQDLRIRIEDGQAMLTFKDKRLENGVEINDEHETAVADPGVLLLLLKRLGAQALVSKTKDGEAWLWGDTLVELSDVAGLGWFVELERVIELPTGSGLQEPGIQALAESTALAIRDSLAALGLEESAIESRSYTSLLLALRAGAN